MENDAATKPLRLAMEMDKEIKARLKKMVAITQLRLALETEEERRAIKRSYLIWIDLDLICIEIGFFEQKFQGMSSLAL